MNGNDPSIAPAAFPPSYTYTPPTWPPPSGGAPFPGNELGPVLNPFPYGSTQGANISTNPPSPGPGYPPPFGSQKGTTYPQRMPNAANGQNQGPGYQLPPLTRPWEVGPIAASPLLSQISPIPKMGPGPQSLTWEVGPLAGTPAPGTTFPAGHYIDGLGTVVTPTRIIGGLGN